MKTKQHTQDIMIVLQAILSMHRMSFHKNDILNTYTFNMNPILTYDKHMFIATLLTFNNILCCIRKMLDKCHLQTTDFIRQNKIGKTYNFKNFRFFNKFLTNPYVDCSDRTYKNVQFVREFIRLLYGFDKGTLLTSIAIHCASYIHLLLLEWFSTTID